MEAYHACSNGNEVNFEKNRELFPKKWGGQESVRSVNSSENKVYVACVFDATDFDVGEPTSSKGNDKLVEVELI